MADQNEIDASLDRLRSLRSPAYSATDNAIDTCDECGQAVEITSDGSEIEVGSDNGNGGIEHECEDDDE
ncbi:hypothetical protein [Kineosporia babensis]|uniref:Uncharacterized protein n=1 Tax=Kineosporia babensis TaxID=499548 RepID=A0A9X1N9K7_9ACTN|nr:hypothetical protein [Kineosporia babensis]MCD5310897.1 hypothetical protein [Kineosporia babensis]